MCSGNLGRYQSLTVRPCGEWSKSSKHTRNYENTHHPRILEVLKQSRWLVFTTRVTFTEHNLSIIGTFVNHNRKIFGAVQHSIIGYFLSTIGSALRQEDITDSNLYPCHCAAAVTNKQFGPFCGAFATP